MKYFVHVGDFVIVHHGDYPRIYKSRKRARLTNFSYMVKFLGWTLVILTQPREEWVNGRLKSVQSRILLLIVACLPSSILLRRSRRRDIWPSLPASLMAIMATVKMHPHVRPVHCITCARSRRRVSLYTSQRLLIRSRTEERGRAGARWWTRSEGVWSEIREKRGESLSFSRRGI